MLAGGILTYFRSEADFRSNKIPVKDVIFRMKHCEMASDDTEAKSGKFGIVITPKNDQGFSA